MTCLTCLTSHEADYFYRFQLFNDFNIFYNFFYSGFYMPGFRIWSDVLSFRVLGFGAIFRHPIIPPFHRPCRWQTVKSILTVITAEASMAGMLSSFLFQFIFHNFYLISFTALNLTVMKDWFSCQVKYILHIVAAMGCTYVLLHIIKN